MKTLKLYINGVKCEFSQGKMNCLTPADIQWCRENRDEINHYKELTRPKELKAKTAQQRKFIEACDSNLLIDVCTQVIPHRPKFAELYTEYQILHFEKFGNYLQPLFIPAEALRFGHKGNGVTVYVTNHEANHDYLTIAHISEDRKLKWYYECDNETRAKVERFAACDNMTRSATQKDLVLTPVKG
jgi:hypothetical protein